MQGTRPSRRDPYAIEVDRGRNCYACRRFGHMVCHYRNQRKTRVADGKRLEYIGEIFEENHKHLNCLKEKENLESLN